MHHSFLQTITLVCHRHTGHIATVYADDDWFIEIECQSAFVDGRCPSDATAVYVFGRQHEVSQELKDMFREKIRARTGDCIDLRPLVFMDKTRELPAPHSRARLSDVVMFANMSQTHILAVQ